MWNSDLARTHVHEYAVFSVSEKQEILTWLSANCPLEVFLAQKQQRAQALKNNADGKNIAAEATQHFPPLIEASPETKDLSNCAVVLTAGGEGERLRLSLAKGGYDEAQLRDFTKATWPLISNQPASSALAINVTLLQRMQVGAIIVTTGPRGSTTHRVISDLKAKGNFSVPVFIVAQDTRLHLSNEQKIVFTKTPCGQLVAAQNPDETGGPIMALRQAAAGDTAEESMLEWANRRGLSRILLLQATALYDPELLLQLASAPRSYDCMGVGILREQFPADDPYGSYVMLEYQAQKKLHILESEIRNDSTRKLQNEQGYHVPFNTGFYAFSPELLRNATLPDYASPPKQITPELAPAPKIGYAATDIFKLSNSAGVIATDTSRFAVLKKADDIEKMIKLAKTYSLVPF